MSTQGIAGIMGLGSTQSGAATSTNSSRTQQMADEGSAAAQTFLNYMKETPAQRMEDAWLAAHGLTRKELDAMTPAQRLAVEKKMEQDIKNEIMKKMQGASSGSAASLGSAAAGTAAD